MAMFGSDWLDDKVDDHESMFSRKHKTDTDFEYFLNENGEYQKIETKRELYNAIDNNNRFEFDGKNYIKKH